MKKNCYLFLCGASFVISCIFSLYSIEYIYPITTRIDNGQELVLFMHQTTTQETRLWSLNVKTNSYEQLLSSRYNPVGVTLLPDNSGFSFLDNGLIKVKSFFKRSPKTIEIYEPIYDFSVPQWLDNEYCFFHAKEGNRYGIYQTDLDGQLQMIIKNPVYDYLYPQKVGDTLFFIARDFAGNCYVKKSKYYATQNEACLHVQNFSQNKLMNLKMINEYEGFVVEYISNSNELLTFNFYKLFCDNDVWNKKILFTFSVPTFLFFDKSIMLRDPMAALFPVVVCDGVYFISMQEKLHTYFYNFKTQCIELCDACSYIPVPNNIFSDNYRHILMSMVTTNGLLSGFGWE